MSGLETRNLSRDSLFLMADLFFAGQPEPVRIKVRNLSAGGMMAEADIIVERGARVTIELRQIGNVQGNVAWTQGRRFGVSFENEIDPKLARSQVGRSEGGVPRYAQPALVKSSRIDHDRPIRPL